MKRLVKIVLLFMSVQLLFFTKVYANEVDQKIDNIQERIEDESDKYVDERLADFVKMAEKYYSDCRLIKAAKVKVEKPFFVYNYVEKTKYAIYNYPVSYNGKVVFIVCVAKVDGEWSLSISQENIDFLNKINYSKENGKYIFFTDGENLFAQSQCMIYSESAFGYSKWNRSFEEKKEIINKETKCLDEINVDSNDNNILDDYSRKYAINTADHVRLSLYNKRGQGNLPICWAASVATMANYINGTKITAGDVCMALKHDYDGASPAYVNSRLSSFGIDYRSFIKESASWTTIKKNINGKWPLYMSSKNSSGNGHATVLYGYQIISGKKYVVIWNPGNEKTYVSAYAKQKTSFYYSNSTFVWCKATISREG